MKLLDMKGRRRHGMIDMEIVRLDDEIAVRDNGCRASLSKVPADERLRDIEIVYRSDGIVRC